MSNRILTHQDGYSEEMNNDHTIKDSKDNNNNKKENNSCIND